ncbi:mitogen-activated protein kinase kinase kinase 20-like [Alnus glutinosa]|uniref:mitogen-activated protein kinase kinase kinase 20-like n=1 Tax=Alnus glutinosa TaxID=3517 RepID=UPI002D76D397|nr:mitogen-activated protein kinase kinase kinase 20-like [Alnus glutinosa]
MDAADHLNFSYCLPSYDFSSIQHHSLPLVPGSPMSWFKVKVLGRGSYGTVHLAISTSTTGSSSSGFFAVKSAVVEHFDSLMKEIEILKEFINCPKIVRGLGFELTFEHGLLLYNLFMEPENILVFSSPDGGSSLKITDFGLSKIPGDLDELMTKSFGFRGTPVYLSPESLLQGEIQACLDIWSLGCVVVEMISGKWAWDCTGGREELAIEIATESPKIPENMSQTGKDFLRRCFERDPRDRWTVEMLLHHPFLLETEGPPSSTRSNRPAWFFCTHQRSCVLLLGLNQFQRNPHCFKKLCLLLLGFLPEASLHDCDQSILSQVWWD